MQSLEFAQDRAIFSILCEFLRLNRFVLMPVQHGRVHGARGLDEVRRQEPARRLPQLARLLRSADVTGQRPRRRRHQQRHQTAFPGDSASATSAANVSTHFVKF